MVPGPPCAESSVGSSIPSASSGRWPRISPPSSVIALMCMIPVLTSRAPAMLSAVGDSSPIQSRSPPKKVRFGVGISDPPSWRTRPQANRPSDNGTAQNWPGTRGAVERGRNGQVVGEAVAGITIRRFRFERTLERSNVSGSGANPLRHHLPNAENMAAGLSPASDG